MWAYDPVLLPLDYFLFFVLAIVVIFTSYTISHLVNVIDKRTKFSGILVAGTVVALVSSLPEFTSSMVAVHSSDNLAAAAGNLSGGNIFRTFALAVTLFFFLGTMKKAKTTIIQVSLVISELFIFAIYFILPWVGNKLGFSKSTCDLVYGIFSGLVLLIYIINLIIMYKFGRNEENIEQQQIHVGKPGFEQKFTNALFALKIRWVVFLFIGLSLVVIGSAMLLGTTAEHILCSWWGTKEENGDWTIQHAGFGCSLLLGIVTSIPEIITVITLLRLGNINAAISDILGSTIFSCVILSIVDLSYWPDPTLHHHYDSLFYGDPGYSMMCFAICCFIATGSIGLILLINYLYRNKEKKGGFTTMIVLCLILIILAYALSIGLSWPKADWYLPGWNPNYLTPVSQLNLYIT